MQIFITGAGGLIGSRLVPLLEESGHKVIRLVRGTPRSDAERAWDPAVERLSPNVLLGCDALVHLAGENIGEGRWTADKKRRIRESRVHSTHLLAQAVAGLTVPPRAFVVASAIGYYGDRGDELLTEKSPPATDFLGEVCQAWEAAADPCRHVTRVIHVRTGVVLASDGGALAKMLLPFKLGLGGVIGSGKQFWSWITVDDIARLFQFALESDGLTGPVNGVTPHPVTNREFTKALGRELHRFTPFPMPAFAARTALGEMADALILASTRVIPEVALDQGFQYMHPQLEPALRSLRL